LDENSKNTQKIRTKTKGFVLPLVPPFKKGQLGKKKRTFGCACKQLQGWGVFHLFSNFALDTGFQSEAQKVECEMQYANEMANCKLQIRIEL